MHYYRELNIISTKRCHWINVTEQVTDCILASGIKSGICIVSSLHTTGGIAINENADPDVERDFFWKLAAWFQKSKSTITLKAIPTATSKHRW